jgi:anti-sigma28 factor (negative regulator of flagellin synthesis)
VSAPQQRATVAAGKEAPAPADRVSVDSPAALSVRAAETEERDVRAARMKKLQQAVENGTYRPDAEATAARMLDSAKWIMELDQEIERLSPES